MELPNNRYDFHKKRRPGKKRKRVLILVLVLVAAGGSVSGFFVLRGNKQFSTDTLSESDMLYELWDARKYDGVIDICRKRLADNPVDPQALALSGFSHFYMALGEYSEEEKIAFIDQALIDLRKANIVESRPYPFEIEYILGKAYFHKGKFYMDQAIRHLTNAVEAGYIPQDIYEYMGLAYAEMGKPKEGISYFLLAAENNSSEVLLMAIAQAYYKLNDKKSSEEYLIRTINKTEEQAIENKARFMLAQIYLDREEYIKSENQYKLILENNPSSADAHYYLGIIYEKMNDTVKARAEWRKALQNDPSHYGARFHYYN